MAGYGKGAATGYSDYYKNNSQTPDNTDDSDLTDNNIQTPSDMIKKRKAAIKRRLAKQGANVNGTA